MRKGWNHNLQYHELVLRNVPRRCEQALDVGCGEGLLTRRLAERCQHVTGMDLEVAAQGEGADARAGSHIRWLRGDVLTHALPLASFDFIAALATLHHLPLREGLERLGALLRPGGVLAIIGLYRAQTPADYAWAAAAMHVSWAVRSVRGHADVRASTRPPRETLHEIRRVARDVLPGATVQRRFFLRYSLVWHKPA